jgi:hypothetical protein
MNRGLTASAEMTVAALPFEACRDPVFATQITNLAQTCLVASKYIQLLVSTFSSDDVTSNDEL